MATAGQQPRLDVRLLLPALVAWAMGATLLAAPTAAVLAVAVVALVTAVTLFGVRRTGGVVVLGCLATTCVLVAVLGHRAVAQAGLVPELSRAKASVQVEAKVVSDPKPVPTKWSDTPMWKVRLQVTRVSGRGAVANSHTPVLAFGGPSVERLHWHDRIVAAGRLEPAQGSTDVQALLRLRGDPQVVRPAGLVEEGVGTLRSDLRQATAGLPDDPAGLVPALLIGDTSSLPPDLDAAMRATGMTHLNAVSGSNVTVVLLCVQWVAGLARVPRRWRLPFSLLGLALFVMLCRPEPSVVRASAMGIVGLLALRAGHARAGAPALAAAILVLLVIDPSLARSYGFVLSALATLGLLLFARPWADAIASRLPKRCEPLAEATSVPLAAQAFCAPVTVLLTPTVPLIGVPANMLAAPLVAPATISAVILVCIAPIAPGLAAVLAWVAAVPAWCIALIARGAAAVPFGSLPWPGGPVGAVSLAAVLLAVLTTGRWWISHGRRRPWAAGAAAVTALAVVTPIPVSAPVGAWIAVACDVGQGDALVLRGSAGHVVLVDVGPDSDAIDSCLRRLGVKSIEAIVLTHFHADHVAGLAGAIRGRSVGEVLTTSVEQDEAASRSDEAGLREPTMALATGHRLLVRPLRRGDLLSWPGIRATVLWPGRVITAGSVQNNGSVVLDVDVLGVRMLLTGDIEREAAANVRRELASSADRRRFTVLKVAHHGSANQDADLVRAVAPQVCLVSVGADNTYGHPAPRTLTLLGSVGCVVLRTDQQGSLVLLRSADGVALGRT